MAETFELTTKTRQNLNSALGFRREEILKVAAPNVRQDGAYFTRALLTLVSNPDTEKLMTTKKGIDSAMTAILNAAMVGVGYGGPKPQAYFVPKDGGVIMVVTATGVRHAVCYGVGAVLAVVPELITVREGDGIKVDPIKATVAYEAGGFDPFDPNRGKVAGWVMRLEFKDGRPAQIRYVSAAKVKEIEDRYGNTNSPMYKKSPEEAAEKTAIKYLLRDVFAESAGLAQMLLEGDVAPEPVKTAPKVERNVTNRVGAALDRAMPELPAEELEPSDQEGDIDAEPGPASTSEQTGESGQAVDDDDLFH